MSARSISAHDSIVARVRELLPVLEEADDHHGLARAFMASCSSSSRTRLGNDVALVSPASRRAETGTPRIRSLRTRPLAPARTHALAHYSHGHGTK